MIGPLFISSKDSYLNSQIPLYTSIQEHITPLTVRKNSHSFPKPFI